VVDCLLCGKPVIEPGELFDSALCQAAWAETTRVRFDEPGTPEPYRTLIGRFIAGQLSEAEEDALLAWLRARGEQG
jgi:hypothetical protein